jgi:hypothetical protein
VTATKEDSKSVVASIEKRSSGPVFESVQSFRDKQ